jgi:GNAT superfamily N-acetyltransferase
LGYDALAMTELLASLFYLGVLALVGGCFAYLYATRDQKRASQEPPPVTSMVITRERPDTPDAINLITELESHLAARYPDESRHGFSVEKLLAEDVAFFLLRAEGTPAGCGGIHLVDGEYGEIKRMYVRPPFRGAGFAKSILDHLAAHAQAHGIDVLRLETGIHQEEAIGLYEGWGFYRIPPFGPYTDDPLSRCYEKRLKP